LTNVTLTECSGAKELTFLVPLSFPTPGTVRQGLVRQSRIFSFSTGTARTETEVATAKTEIGDGCHKTFFFVGTEGGVE
jgi:hypothetical protein